MCVWSALRPDGCVAVGGAECGGHDGAGGAHIKQGEDGSRHRKEKIQGDECGDEEGFDEKPQADEPGKQGQPGGKGGADSTDPAGVCSFDGAAADGATAGYDAHS